MKTDAPSPGGPNPGTRSHVAREHFVYIKLLALEAQEFKYTNVLLRCTAITTALGKLQSICINMKAPVDMSLMWRGNAFLRFVTIRERVKFCF